MRIDAPELSNPIALDDYMRAKEELPNMARSLVEGAGREIERVFLTNPALGAGRTVPLKPTTGVSGAVLSSRARRCVSGRHLRRHALQHAGPCVALTLAATKSLSRATACRRPLARNSTPLSLLQNDWHGNAGAITRAWSAARVMIEAVFCASERFPGSA